MKGTRWLKNAPGNCLRWCSFTECKGQVKWAKQPKAIVHERSRVHHFSEGGTLHRIEFQGSRFPELAESGARVSIASRSEKLFSVLSDICSTFGLGLAAAMSLRGDSDDVDSAPGKMEESRELPRALMPLWDQMRDT